MEQLLDERAKLDTLKANLKDAEKLVSNLKTSIWSTERNIGSLEIKVNDCAKIESTDSTILNYTNNYFSVKRCNEGQEITIGIKKFVIPQYITIKPSFSTVYKPVDVKYFKNCISYIIEDGVHVVSETDEAVVALNCYKNSRYPEVLYASFQKIVIKIDSYDRPDYFEEEDELTFYKRMFGFETSDTTRSVIAESEYKDGFWSEFAMSTLSVFNLNINDMITKSCVSTKKEDLKKVGEDLKDSSEASGDTSSEASSDASGDTSSEASAKVVEVEEPRTNLYVNFDYRFILSPNLNYFAVLTFKKHESYYSRNKKNTKIYKIKSVNEYEMIFATERKELEKEFLDNDIVLFTPDNKLMIIGKTKCDIYDPEFMLLT